MHLQARSISLLHAFQQVGHQVQYRHHQRISHHPLMGQYLMSCQFVFLQQAESITHILTYGFPIYLDITSVHRNRTGVSQNRLIQSITQPGVFLRFSLRTVHLRGSISISQSTYPVCHVHPVILNSSSFPMVQLRELSGIILRAGGVTFFSLETPVICFQFIQIISYLLVCELLLSIQPLIINDCRRITFIKLAP